MSGFVAESGWRHPGLGSDSTEARSPERKLILDMSDRNSMSQPPCGR